jgi:hypothetical protein
VLVALASSFERWNGRGSPTGTKGTAIPKPMRVAQLSQELEVLARIEGVTRALEIVRARRAGAYDPLLTDLVLELGANWWEEVEPADPWDTVGCQALGPSRHDLRPLSAEPVGPHLTTEREDTRAEGLTRTRHS